MHPQGEPPIEIKNRLEKLSRKGKRCAGNSLNCTRTAYAEIRVVFIDPETGRPRGDEQLRKVCFRHLKDYGTQGNGYAVLSGELLAEGAGEFAIPENARYSPNNAQPRKPGGNAS